MAGKKDLLELGSIVGEQFLLKSHLGRGGMANVYLVEELENGNREIALKVLHAHLTEDPKHTQRFLREEKLSRRVQHPNIVKTHSAGIADGRIYFTMEYLPGESIKQRLSRLPIEVADAVGIAMEISRGLSAIHKAGIIHRDLKPANVILTESGEVKISDFGIARPGASNLTETREVLGSIHYTAPEVWRGEDLTPSIDIYSLGVLTFEMVTGIRMFDGDVPHELMYKHCSVEPVAAIDINNHVPVWLSQMISRMCSKKASERPPSATHIVHELRKLLDRHQSEMREQDRRFSSLVSTVCEGDRDSEVELEGMGLQGTRENVHQALIPLAGDALLKSWSPEQDKLDAIDFLQYSPSDMALDYLVQAMEKHYRNVNEVLGDGQWSRTDKVAGRAAKALARLQHPGGEQYLVDALEHMHHDPQFLECATFGLAGSNSSEALKGFCDLLDSESENTRHMAVQALLESMYSFEGNRDARVANAVQSLAAYLFETPLEQRTPEFERGFEGACNIVQDCLCEKVEKFLIETLIENPVLDNKILALELLQASRSVDIQHELVELLKRKGLDAQVYVKIGELLRDSRELYVHQVAKEIINEPSSWVDELLSKMMQSWKRQQRERKKAAMVIRDQADPLLPTG